MSPEDAMAELKKYEELIKKEGVHEAFPKYAEQRSDCSSFKHQGDLGDFGRGMLAACCLIYSDGDSAS